MPCNDERHILSKNVLCTHIRARIIIVVSPRGRLPLSSSMAAFGGNNVSVRESTKSLDEIELERVKKSLAQRFEMSRPMSLGLLAVSGLVVTSAFFVNDTASSSDVDYASTHQRRMRAASIAVMIVGAIGLIVGGQSLLYRRM